MMHDERDVNATFAEILRKLGAHPSALVIAALRDGARRLSEILAAQATLDETTVTKALRELDAEAFVTRRVDPGPPLRVLYVLTESGTELAPSIGTLADWALRNP